MKFWISPHKNFTDQVGRWVYEDKTTPLQSQNIVAESDLATMLLRETSGVLSDGAREAAMLDTEMALSSLQKQIEEEQLNPGELPLEEQIKILVRIARNDKKSDGEGDDRSTAEYLRDTGGGLIDGFLSSDAVLLAQNLTNFSTEAYILEQISFDAKSRFLLDYPVDAKNLFTDKIGKDGSKTTYRADFHGDIKLSNESNFMDLLSSTNPNEQFLQMNDEVYVRTAYGYLGFSPEGIVGNRARIGNGTIFTTFKEDEDHAAILVELKTQYPVFNQIENSDVMVRLEQNRNTNYRTGETWKSFADSILPSLAGSEIPFIQELSTLFETSDNGGFRKFLDANTRLDNYNSVSVGEPFIIPGFGEVQGLDALSNSTNFREGIMKAIKKITEYAETEIQKYKVAIEAESNAETKALMIESLEALQNSMPNLLGTIKSHVEHLKETNQRLLEANSQLILAEFENLNPDELNRWLTEFDNSLTEMADEGSFNSDTFDQQLGLLLAKILGSSAEEGLHQLEQNPQLKIILQARLNSLVRTPGIDHLEGTVMIFEQQMYVKGIVQALGSIDGSMIEGVDINNITPDQLIQLLAQAQNVRDGLEMRVKNDGSLSGKETQLLEFLNISIPALSRSETLIGEGKEMIDDATSAEGVLQDSVARGTEILNPETEAGEIFHEIVDVNIQYVRQYREENNGEIPDMSAEDFQFVADQIKSGVPPQVIINELQLKSDPNFQTATPKQQIILSENLSSIPAQTNFVGLTPNGEYIIESTGTDQTKFIQSATDGTIIAEHLLGVPDAEDLRVPPTQWATAQALGAMTDGFVIKSAAELAQAGETLGNRALVNFMKQYWGIRGNNTLPESELDKFKSLGEMMSANHINLHTVLFQLNAVKWDNTADGSRALDVRRPFNEVLAAAAAGNNKGFRALLNLDNLSPEAQIT